MNLQSFIEFNRFKELVSSKKQAGWCEEINALKDIKEAESLPVDERVLFGRSFILVGLSNNDPHTRPVVYNYESGSEYPKPEKLAFFPKIDLLQNIVEMQDAIEVVADLEEDLGMIEVPFSPETTKLFNVCVVYGKAIKKGQKLVPSLTLAEVTSQLALQHSSKSNLLFYVCDVAEEAGNLTTRAGYHAYRVAVYTTSDIPDELKPELSIDGCIVE